MVLKAGSLGAFNNEEFVQLAKQITTEFKSVYVLTRLPCER